MQPSAYHHSNEIEPSELIVRPDGAIYHIGIRPDQIADNIIVVGDPGRVQRISSKFDTVDHKVANREFITHTGTFNGVRISAVATGIGPDNIDIVLNELDALVNIDLETKKIREKKRSLNIVRIGTSGALHEDIPVDSFVVSEYGLGFDGVLGYYDHDEEEDEKLIRKAVLSETDWSPKQNPPYVVRGNKELVDQIGEGLQKGVTITANGFYGPQGRILRLRPNDPNLNEKLRSINVEGKRITNYEMETASLYGLSALLGHKACTVCCIIANRYSGQYSKDYKRPIGDLIDLVINRLTSSVLIKN